MDYKTKNKREENPETLKLRKYWRTANQNRTMQKKPENIVANSNAEVLKMRTNAGGIKRTNKDIIGELKNKEVNKYQ